MCGSTHFTEQGLVEFESSPLVDCAISAEDHHWMRTTLSPGRGQLHVPRIRMTTKTCVRTCRSIHLEHSSELSLNQHTLRLLLEAISNIFTCFFLVLLAQRERVPGSRCVNYLLTVLTYLLRWQLVGAVRSMQRACGCGSGGGHVEKHRSSEHGANVRLLSVTGAWNALALTSGTGDVLRPTATDSELDRRHQLPDTGRSVGDVLSGAVYGHGGRTAACLPATVCRAASPETSCAADR